MPLHQEVVAAELSPLLLVELGLIMIETKSSQDTEVVAEAEAVPEETVVVTKLVTMELEEMASNSMTKSEAAVNNMEINTEEDHSMVIKIEATPEAAADLEDKSHTIQAQITTMTGNKDSMMAKIMKLRNQEDKDKETKVEQIVKINDSKDLRDTLIISMKQLP